jgi:ABC-type histidine transport system ATPase subunit
VRFDARESDQITNRRVESLHNTYLYCFNLSLAKRTHFRKRLCISDLFSDWAMKRALALKPRIVLMDDPTSALDPELVGDVLAVALDLNKSGITMIMPGHG